MRCIYYIWESHLLSTLCTPSVYSTSNPSSHFSAKNTNRQNTHKKKWRVSVFRCTQRRDVSTTIQKATSHMENRLCTMYLPFCVRALSIYDGVVLSKPHAKYVYDISILQWDPCCLASKLHFRALMLRKSRNANIMRPNAATLHSTQLPADWNAQTFEGISPTNATFIPVYCIYTFKATWIWNTGEPFAPAHRWVCCVLLVIAIIRGS